MGTDPAVVDGPNDSEKPLSRTQGGNHPVRLVPPDVLDHGPACAGVAVRAFLPDNHYLLACHAGTLIPIPPDSKTTNTR